METWQIILIALIPVFLAPLVYGLRRKLGLGKKKINLIVTCPYCGSDIGLEKLRNYICGNCSQGVAFFDLETGAPHPQAKFFNCAKCGEKNFAGLKNCQKCGRPVEPSA